MATPLSGISTEMGREARELTDLALDEGAVFWPIGKPNYDRFEYSTSMWPSNPHACGHGFHEDDGLGRRNLNSLNPCVPGSPG